MSTYRARHDSAIVDIFQGQHVTVRDCPDCGHKSRRFETYMYITAPIPGSDTAARNFMVVPVGGFSKAQKACVRLRNSDTVRTFLTAAAGIAGVDADAAPQRLFAAMWPPGKPAETKFLDDLDAVLPPQKPAWPLCVPTWPLLRYEHAGTCMPAVSVGLTKQGSSSSSVLQLLTIAARDRCMTLDMSAIASVLSIGSGHLSHRISAAELVALSRT